MPHILPRPSALNPLRAAVLALALGLPAGTAVAADPAPTAATKTADDPVVARVNKTEIHRSEVLDTIATLPPQYRAAPPEQLYSRTLSQLIDLQLVYQAAAAAKLENDAVVKQQIAKARERAMEIAYIDRVVDKETTNARLHQTYDEMVKKTPKAEEVHARHILVKTEAEAKDIIAQLDKGAKFEDLAGQKSADASAKQGGDLGYFTKDQMVPEFADAAFALKPGAYTKTPVKTQFGWHVIKVEDRREAKVPSFEESKEQLAQQVRQEVIDKTLKSLRDNAKITEYKENAPTFPQPQAPHGK